MASSPNNKSNVLAPRPLPDQNGLTLWWPLTDSTANDISGNQNHGTLTGLSGVAAYGQNIYGQQALSLDNVNTEYVQVASNSQLLASAVTVSFWINPTSFPNAYTTCVANQANSGGAAAYGCYIKSTGKLAFYVIAGANLNYDGTGTYTVPTGVWTHVVYTYDSVQGGIAYVNGLIDGSFAANGALAGSSPNTLFLGHDSSADRHVYGLLSDVKIYNRALSATEVNALYNQSPNNTVSENDLPALNPAAARPSVATAYTHLGPYGTPVASSAGGSVGTSAGTGAAAAIGTSTPVGASAGTGAATAQAGSIGTSAGVGAASGVAATITIDSSGDDREGKGVTSITLTRLTGTGINVSAGAIIIVNVASNDAGGLRTVSSITDNKSLVWAKRAAGSVNGGTYSSNIGCEVWWAYTASALTALQITVNMNTTTDIVVGNCYSFKGFSGVNYTASPWDANTALPHIATHGAGGATTPGATVTTTDAYTALLGNMACDANIAGDLGSGYSQAGQPQYSNNSAAIANNSQYQTVSTSQSGAADNISPQTVAGWVFITDALSQFGGAAVAQANGVGVAAAIAGSIGASAGVGAATGQAGSKGLSAGVGAALGSNGSLGTSTGVGAAAAQAGSIGVSTGIGAASATGTSTPIGAAAGTGAASAIGTSTPVGASLGVGAAAGQAGSIGLSAGTGVATAQAGSIGASAGIGAAIGLVGSIGASAGIGAAIGQAGSIGNAAGIGAVNGVSQVAGSIGNSTGTGAASAQAGSIGNSAGTSTASAQAGSIGLTNGVGNAAALSQTDAVGSATGTGATSAQAGSIGAANGVGSASAFVQTQAVGAATGTGAAAAQGSAELRAIGSAAGIGGAQAQAQAQSVSIGSANGIGSAMGQPPLAGAKLYFYAASTSTPQTVYADAAATIPRPNPIVLDAHGSPGSVFLAIGEEYKVMLFDAKGNEIWMREPVSGFKINLTMLMGLRAGIQRDRRKSWKQRELRRTWKAPQHLKVRGLKATNISDIKTMLQRANEQPRTPRSNRKLEMRKHVLNRKKGPL